MPSQAVLAADLAAFYNARVGRQAERGGAETAPALPPLPFQYAGELVRGCFHCCAGAEMLGASYCLKSLMDPHLLVPLQITRPGSARC